MPPEASSANLPADHLDRLAHGGGIHVVEQHRVREPDLDHLAQLIERVDLDLDLDQMAGGGLGALEHGADAARDRDVVVLDQDRVVEAEAVIEAAAAAHGVFLERAQPRRGLARAADARARAGDAAHEFMRRGRDAREMAEKIERDALGRKHRAGRAGRPSSARSWRRRWRRRALRGDLDLGRELGEGRGHQRQAGDHAGLRAPPRWRAPTCPPGWSQSRSRRRRGRGPRRARASPRRRSRAARGRRRGRAGRWSWPSVAAVGVMLRFKPTASNSPSARPSAAPCRRSPDRSRPPP